MQAEIIAIGTELLLGVTVDTNSAYLARQLASIGVPVVRVTLVRDVFDEMVEAIATAARRSRLVICSGGLGPTGDDLTREAIARALDRPLEFHQFLLDDIAARFEAYKRVMSPSNRQQAFVPQGAYIIRNPRGTAPAFVAERDGRLVAALPGVPAELEYLTEHALLPYLRDEHGLRDVIVVREVRVSGLPESVAGERIADMMNLPNPIVGITAKRGQHTIRIAATATDRDAAEAMIAPLVESIEERFGGHLLGSEALEERVGSLLDARGLSLVLHEAVPQAPTFRTLVAVPTARAALAGGGAMIRAWEPASGTPDEHGLAHVARAGLEQAPAGAKIALVIVPAPDAIDEHYQTVHFLVTDGTRNTYLARGFDLRIAVGYDLVAAGGLELLRRWLEADTDQGAAP